MDDIKYDVAFKLIADAGDSRSDSIHAINLAQEGKIKEAEETLISAKDKMAKAHSYQFELISKEANGETIDINLILVHAEDHLTMAIIMLDTAKAFIETYKMMKKLEEYVNEHIRPI